MDSVLLNICLLPTSEVAAAIVDLTRRASGQFVVDGTLRQPHLTVFMARFDVEVVPKVVSTLETSALPGRGVHLNHTGYLVTKNRYYEAGYARTTELADLQQDVSDLVSDLRWSPGAPVVEDYFVPTDRRQMRHARETGYDLFGPDFRPHITITRFEPPVPRELPEWAGDLSFEAGEISVYAADPLGAATRLIWRG